MKEITKQLKSFLESNFIKNNGIHYSRFSSLSEKFISRLFELMIEAHEILDSIKIDIQHIKDQQSIPRSSDHNYIPSNILNEIEKMDKHAYLYSFKLKGKEYQVAFIYPINPSPLRKQKADSNLRWFKQRINKIIMWLYIANAFASEKCSQKMNIFIYFTQLEKNLPRNTKSISRENANTAFTTSCKLITELNIFREEEWFKVFIHETFHNLGLDFSSMNENLSQKSILSIFPVKSDVNLFETYCEMWAEIMNIMFIVFSSCIKEKEEEKEKKEEINIPSMIKKTEQLLHYERIFSVFQCIKVLHFFGLSYTDLYEKSNNKQLARDHKFKENRTNVLAYYILKSIYMFYLNDFLEWCIENNNNSLDFNKTNENIKQYCIFIKEHYNEKEFLNIINIIEEWFLINNKCNNECNTMRMTLFEDT
jgi:hypothetical protein